jgi:selenide,water dikinase
MGPGALSTTLAALRLPTHPNLLIGLDVSDDAAVYQINDQQAIVQTVDFFPPIVDDPYTFGAIAAANSLSDIYAMGARPILALAIAAFPEDLGREVIQAILQGGADKVAEAGAVIAGGHTVVDNEPKYGLCVTGLIAPHKVTAKANAQPGDVLLLTKPLGTGVITTASKRGVGDPAHLAAAIASMLRLNKVAAELAQTVEVHGATDITGFGILGHAAEVARNSGVGLRIDVDALPLLPGALDYAMQGVVPGGLGRNQDYFEQDRYVHYTDNINPARKLLLFDPQTSGGLFVVLPPAAAAELEQRYADADQPCWRIGEVVAGSGIEII